MNTTYAIIEELLLNEYSVSENSIGLGKIIVTDCYTESLITNGKSLITYLNIKLKESDLINDEERLRIVNLSRKLIKQRLTKDTLCELYLTKKNVSYILEYLHKLNINSVIELKYNHVSNRLFIMNEPTTLIKMINISFKNNTNVNGVVKLDVGELIKVMKLIYIEMSHGNELLLTIQTKNKPIILNMNNVSACILAIN